MTHRLLAALVGPALGVLPIAALAAEPLRVPRIEAKPAVDGVLDEGLWQSALVVELPFEVAPGDNPPAPVRTEALITHDAENLYLGFRAYDPDPSKIRAHLSDRDNLGNDDWVGVTLDTFNDERRDYLFLVNPYGVQLDRIEMENSDPVGWDGIWESAARIHPWGWAAELRIPFKSLSFQSVGGEQVWGFDAIRGYPRQTWKQMGAFRRDRNTNCYMCQAIKIRGFEGIKPAHNLELDPTLTSLKTEVRDEMPDGELDSGETETDAGLTARWGVTPNLTLLGTLNPDFSQVEADALQLDVNEPFALQYEEKRPFFMEAADFFRTPLDLVYTRTIRDPAWGIKLTGKEGAHTVASYVTQDEITNLVFPGSEMSSAVSLDMRTLDSVVRYKRDFGSRTTLGLLATDREGDDYFNRVASFEGDVRLTDTDRVRALVMGSSTCYPDDVAASFGQPLGTFGDLAWEAVYSRDTRNFDAYVHVRDIGVDFRADQGFIPRVGYRGGEAGAEYEWIGEEGDWYTELDLGGLANTFDGPEGDLLLREAQVTFNYQGSLQSHVQLQATHQREGFRGQLFDQDEFLIHNCMQPSAWAGYWFTVRWGDRIDYANVRLGQRLRVNPGGELRLGPHVYLSLDATYERMTVDEGWLFTARIAQLTTAYQFNARSFVRAIVQHVDQDYNAELYNDGREAQPTRLFGQLLFSYKLNPRTVLFIGATDNRLGNEAYEPTTAERTIFAKVGYAWAL
jgi:hypothetical protein